jgi:hypothetical protein
VVSEPDATKRRDALLIWAAARERAVDELRRRAARLSREGLEDEARRLRAAAHALHVCATQERAQAAAYEPEEKTSTARELGGRGHSGWQSECSSKRRDSRRKVHGRGRV